jgi:hypothetical protein
VVIFPVFKSARQLPHYLSFSNIIALIIIIERRKITSTYVNRKRNLANQIRWAFLVTSIYLHHTQNIKKHLDLKHGRMMQSMIHVADSKRSAKHVRGGGMRVVRVTLWSIGH